MVNYYQAQDGYWIVRTSPEQRFLSELEAKTAAGIVQYIGENMTADNDILFIQRVRSVGTQMMILFDTISAMSRVYAARNYGEVITQETIDAAFPDGAPFDLPKFQAAVAAIGAFPGFIDNQEVTAADRATPLNQLRTDM